MARNHGMTRSVSTPSVYNNPLVDSRFDFNFLGNNFRNTDIHAYIGLQDFKRINKLKAHRVDMYNLYRNTLKVGRSFLPSISDRFSHVPFCLPVFCQTRDQKSMFISYCNNSGIETRPIISGNLLRQTCYRKYGDYNQFPNSEFLNDKCFYIGLHGKTKADHVVMVAEAFNKNFN
jgi:CDP-6-deoxy-D-xylo-4-hexulose-3-dehydrase